MIVAGFGFRGECGADELAALFMQGCGAHGLEAAAIRIFATLPEKAGAPQLSAVAARFSAGVVAPPLERLRAAADRCLTRSAASEIRFGLPSVAEAAALAAAGPGARLLGPRLQSLRATIAFAARDGAPG